MWFAEKKEKSRILYSHDVGVKFLFYKHFLFYVCGRFELRRTNSIIFLVLLQNGLQTTGLNRNVLF